MTCLIYNNTLKNFVWSRLNEIFIDFSINDLKDSCYKNNGAICQNYTLVKLEKIRYLPLRWSVNCWISQKSWFQIWKVNEIRFQNIKFRSTRDRGKYSDSLLSDVSVKWLRPCYLQTISPARKTGLWKGF